MTQIIETDDPVAKAASKIAEVLRAAIAANGRASLMVSGGSSTKPRKRALARSRQIP